MRKLKFIASLILSLTFNLLVAQTKDLKEEAAYAFDNKDYKTAYECYDKLYAESPKNLEYKFRLGFCSIRYPEKKARAIEIFEDMKRTDKSPEVDYYLGKAYHLNYRFDDAIDAYNEFLAVKRDKIKEEEQVMIDDATLGLQNCKNGKELIAKKVIADIKNMGEPLNTSEDEYVPVISMDESVLIYTYVGKNTTGGKLNDDLLPDNDEGYFHEDVYIAKKTNDSTFSAGVNIGTNINTMGNDAPIALSPDGNTLFTYTSTDKDRGDIYISNLNGEEWSKPERLNKNINTSEWEGSCSISSDGRFLYFASEREGGLGGRDLYVSEKTNGDWGPAKNLGPKINTPYNEDAPFIHPDGITLFFSSEGHKSIGGYDIMYSVKQENDWIEPLSMGIPLNTTEDDRYYVINAKGDVGYFSSNRGGTGGKGGQDIYCVTPGILGEKPILALLKGKVYANDVLTEAKLEVIKIATDEVVGPYYANSKTGKYLMALSPGKIKVKVMVNGFEPIQEEFDIEKLTKFLEIRKDFYVYSADFAHKPTQRPTKFILDSLLGKTPTDLTFKNDVYNNANVVDANSPVKTATTAVTTTPTNVVPCEGTPIPDFTSLKGKSLNDPAVYKEFLKIGGSTCAEGMVFKVQIAAYRHPENYKYDHLKQFGKPEIVNYPDGITRFTQFQFSTIKEAEAARQKIIAKGQKDAWITAVINGNRYTLEELIMVNFMSKAIN